MHWKKNSFLQKKEFWRQQTTSFSSIRVTLMILQRSQRRFQCTVYVKLTSFIELKFIIFKIQFFERDGKHHAGTRQFETEFRFLCHFISHETRHYQLWGWDAWERFSFLWYQHHMFDIKFNVETLKCEFASLVFYPAAVDTFEFFAKKLMRPT